MHVPRFPHGNRLGDAEVEKLASEIAAVTGETETEALREALRERHERVVPKSRHRGNRYATMQEFLEKEIWPHIPPEELDRPPMTKAEVEEILGIGPEGIDPRQFSRDRDPPSGAGLPPTASGARKVPL